MRKYSDYLLTGCELLRHQFRRRQSHRVAVVELHTHGGACGQFLFACEGRCPQDAHPTLQETEDAPHATLRWVKRASRVQMLRKDEIENLNDVPGLEDQYIRAVEWQNSFINELDISSTELNEETLRDMLLRMPGFTYLGVGHCEFFSDQVSNAHSNFQLNFPWLRNDFVPSLDFVGLDSRWKTFQASSFRHWSHGDAVRHGHLPIHPSARSPPARFGARRKASSCRTVLPQRDSLPQKYQVHLSLLECFDVPFTHALFNSQESSDWNS